MNEIKILESIDHPNIIKYHESFINKNKFVIVMEYANKGNSIIKFVGDLKMLL